MFVFYVVWAVVALSSGAGMVSRENLGQAAGQPSAIVKHSRPIKCEGARRAVPFYRVRTWDHQLAREALRLANRTPLVRGKSCHWARYAAREHNARAEAARERTERWHVQMQDPEFAICHYWGSRCQEAIAVASCESGDRDGDLSPHVVRASNGQYQGMFQMGSSERATYGHGSTPREQAKAAHAYFVASGSDWSPWQCRPYGLAW